MLQVFNFMGNQEILDYVEKHLLDHKSICVRKDNPKGPIWEIWDGPVTDQHSERLGFGSCLRAAVLNAVKQPYGRFL